MGVSIIRRCGGTCRHCCSSCRRSACSGVSIIRRCGGTCRLVILFLQLQPLCFLFQSSEDVGGHADILMLLVATTLVGTFQSSEDVGGHADGSSFGLGTQFGSGVSIIRRCGGTCRLDYTISVYSSADFLFQSSEDVGGHADLSALPAGCTSSGGFNHPKMWGDMPTRRLYNRF